jgi:hypothetical protein
LQTNNTKKKNKPVYHLVDLNSMRVIIATVLKLPTVATRFATISVYSLVDASSSCSDTTLYTRVTTLSILCSTLEERRALVRPSPSTPMMTPMMTIMMVQSVYARLRDGDPHVSHSVRWFQSAVCSPIPLAGSDHLPESWNESVKCLLISCV